jgi:1-acyl-sn-glycerol-3-phosphate acyltransferase
MIYARALLTLFYVATVIPALGLVAWIPVHGQQLRLRVRRRWIKWILHGLNVRMEWQGEVPDEPVILVANHRSWLDPLLVLRHILALPVAKAEMGGWPLLGLAGRLSGIFYVQRENMRDRQRTLEAVAEAVQQGQSILLFPEGTTHDHTELMPFRKGIFQVAARHGVPVVPIALEFADPGDYWLGNDTFVDHFRRQFGHRKVQCRVHVGPTLRSEDALVLMHASRDWIQQQIPHLRIGFGDVRKPDIR